MAMFAGACIVAGCSDSGSSQQSLPRIVFAVKNQSPSGETLGTVLVGQIDGTQSMVRVSCTGQGSMTFLVGENLSAAVIAATRQANPWGPLNSTSLDLTSPESPLNWSLPSPGYGSGDVDGGGPFTCPGTQQLSASDHHFRGTLDVLVKTTSGIHWSATISEDQP